MDKRDRLLGSKSRYLAETASSRGATHDEYVGENTPPGKTLPQSSDGPLKFCPAKKDIDRLAHAASRSRAER
jgi:hypothetical protein